MERSWCVYRHTVPDGRMYIGVAMEPANSRWQNGKGYRSNPEFWKCICEVGWDNIAHEIVISGLDSRGARKLESELIDLYGTMFPNGFNRRVDGCGKSYKYRKKEVGRMYGRVTVVDYWADSDGMKKYEMRCSCGRFFCVRWDEITDDLSCGCKVKLVGKFSLREDDSNG